MTNVIDARDECPHCGHHWDVHWTHCVECGCMWPAPTNPPELPRPPSTRELRISRVEDAIWSELERQSEEEDFGPYVDREMGMVDVSGSSLDMTSVAAVIVALFEGGIDQ